MDLRGRRAGGRRDDRPPSTGLSGRDYARRKNALTLHTDIPTRSEIERLLATRDACCVSIYLSTSTITREAQSDRIELKNLAAAATEQLEAAGADQRAVAEIRDGLKDL